MAPYEALLILPLLPPPYMPDILDGAPPLPPKEEVKVPLFTPRLEVVLVVEGAYSDESASRSRSLVLESGKPLPRLDKVPVEVGPYLACLVYKLPAAKASTLLDDFSGNVDVGALTADAREVS